ncbi:MAG: metalloprotease PmbA [Gammaproteobacteria bacterium]
MEQEELEQLVADTVQTAKRAGARQAEASASIETGLSVSVRMGEVETLEYQRDRGLGITVYFGKQKGTASTTDFSSKAVQATVDAACAIAKQTTADEFSGLADADRMATQFPELDLDHPWTLSPEAAIDIALIAEKAALDVDPRINNSEGATLTTHRSNCVYANTHGFMGDSQTTYHSTSCAVIGKDGDKMQRDYWYSVARCADDLIPPEEVGRIAGERTIERLHARQIKTRQAKVLYTPDVARTLFGHFIAASRGTSQYRKSTFLLDSVGQQVFPSFVNITEQPHLPRALGSAGFDNEGVATFARDIVSAGELQGYFLGSYAARKLGMTSTANAGGVHNLVVQPGELDFNSMLNELGSGLLVRELIGHGVNPVTGDYSRGAAGFWVENGEIAFPVEEITIAGNLRDMFAGVLALGNDTDTRSNIRCGSMLIDNMKIAGK